MKIQKSKIYCSIFFLISIAFSQSGSITGYITDSGKKEPLIGANIYVMGTSLGTASNDEGRYTIVNVAPGDYTLKISYIGYESKEFAITVAANERITQDFELDYATIEGKTVEVTAQARGQMDAINKQLNSKSLVNIISSDRIQELPDATFLLCNFCA